MIRPAQQNDVGGIVKLLNSTIGGTQNPDQISAWVDTPSTPVLVALNAGDLHGAVLGRIIDDEAEIYDVAVSPDHRRCGLGRGLVSAFIEHCQHHGVKAVFLEVRKGNQPAIQLYGNLGFSLQGERTDYYANGESALVLGWSIQ